MPRTFRSSIASAWFSRHSLVVSLWVKSLRTRAMRACSRASASAPLVRFFDAGRRVPLTMRPTIPAAALAASSLRDCRRERMRRRRSAAFNGRGAAIFSPLDSVAALVTPRSTPVTASPVQRRRAKWSGTST